MRELSAQLTEGEKSRNPESKLLGGGFYITVWADIIRPQNSSERSGPFRKKSLPFLQGRLFFYSIGTRLSITLNISSSGKFFDVKLNISFLTNHVMLTTSPSLI